MSGRVLHALKVFCLAKYVQDLDANIETSTWEDAITFNDKYAVNAENLKCKILSVPLFNLI